MPPRLAGARELATAGCGRRQRSRLAGRGSAAGASSTAAAPPAVTDGAPTGGGRARRAHRSPRREADLHLPPARLVAGIDDQLEALPAGLVRQLHPHQSSRAASGSAHPSPARRSAPRPLAGAERLVIDGWAAGRGEDGEAGGRDRLHLQGQGRVARLRAGGERQPGLRLIGWPRLTPCLPRIHLHGVRRNSHTTRRRGASSPGTGRSVTSRAPPPARCGDFPPLSHHLACGVGGRGRDSAQTLEGAAPSAPVGITPGPGSTGADGAAPSRSSADRYRL